MDLYTVILIVESTGHRFILEGISAEVEAKIDYNEFRNASGEVVNRSVKSSNLDIVLTIYKGFEFNEKYEQLKQMVFDETLLLSFKDVHPCLIRGYVNSMTMDVHKATINFIGNTLDKTLEEFIHEVEYEVGNWLNAQQTHWQSSESNNSVFSSDPPPPPPTPGFKKKVKFKKQKTKIPKRKLTF